MLFADATQVSTVTGHADLDAITVCHHLIARASPHIQLPHVRQRWSEAEYVVWLETHPPAEVRALLQASLDAYAADVHRRGHKQYILEYPVLVRLLETIV